MKSKHNLVKIFVYGTLRKGYGLHSQCLTNSKFLGDAETVEKYAMYVNAIPYVIKDDKVSTIKGEVYLVDPYTLEAIDRIEGHPNWYRREKIKVKYNTGKTDKAWLYFSRQRSGDLFEEGDYNWRPKEEDILYI